MILVSNPENIVFKLRIDGLPRLRPTRPGPALESPIPGTFIHHFSEYERRKLGTDAKKSVYSESYGEPSGRMPALPDSKRKKTTTRGPCMGPACKLLGAKVGPEAGHLGYILRARTSGSSASLSLKRAPRPRARPGRPRITRGPAGSCVRLIAPPGGDGARPAHCRGIASGPHPGVGSPAPVGP